MLNHHNRFFDAMCLDCYIATYVASRAVPIQHFKFNTDTNIFVLIPINKFYSTNIIKLTDISFYLPILMINVHNQLKTLVIDQVLNNLGLACYHFPHCVLKCTANPLIMPATAIYWVLYCSRTSVLQVFCLFSYGICAYFLLHVNIEI